MAGKLNLEIVLRETIKPSYPTPIHLKNFELSLLDQFAPVLHTRVLLFFSESPTDENNNNSAKKSKLLRESLAQTLNSFYPFAGRIRENHSIDCNDEGAEFVETKVHFNLSPIMDKPDPELLIQLVPSDRVLSKEVPLLLVQANFFECGGLAVGVSISHKIADAATISSFLSCWALKTSDPSSDISLIAQFVSPPRVPSHDSLAMLPQGSAQKSIPEKIAVTRLVFHGKNITALRAKVSSPIVQNPTRVEAVLALIWKCAMEASRSSSGSLGQRHSVLFQAVSLRKLLSLQEKTSGNFAWSYAVKCEETQETELVALLRKGLEDFKRSYDTRITWDGMRAHVDEYLKLRKNGDMDIYLPTSWCRFPFYGVDFGWGKPSWVCVPNVRAKNSIVLMDASDGDGMDVWLALGVDQMSHFQTNQSLLEFAYFNQSAMS